MRPSPASVARTRPLPASPETLVEERTRPAEERATFTPFRAALASWADMVRGKELGFGAKERVEVSESEGAEG